MKKNIIIILAFMVISCLTPAFACKDCDCDCHKNGEKCNCKKECPKDCDCGCVKGEKCNCNCDCDCGCNKRFNKFKNFFKRNKIKCNCENQ